jgi:hypothetical protein
VSTSVCLPCQTTALPKTESTPVRLPKRFTIARHASKINKPRITVTDNTACITSSYSYATAQELVKELANAVGMLVYTPGNVMEMPREQSQMSPSGEPISPIESVPTGVRRSAIEPGCGLPR